MPWRQILLQITGLWALMMVIGVVIRLAMADPMWSHWWALASLSLAMIIVLLDHRLSPRWRTAPDSRSDSGSERAA